MISQSIRKTCLNKSYYAATNRERVRKAVDLFFDKCYNVAIDEGSCFINCLSIKEIEVRKKNIAKEDMGKDLIINPKRVGYYYDFYVSAKDFDEGYLRLVAPEKHLNRLKEVIETTDKEYKYVNK